MNVFKDLFNMLKNGSLTGYFSEPHNVTCSKICATPVESVGIVLKVTLKLGFYKVFFKNKEISK